MFKTDSCLGNKKLSLSQNIWHDHATMQQNVLLHFWVIFYTKMRPKYEEIILLSSSRAFQLSTPIENSEAIWKKATKCNKIKFKVAEKKKKSLIEKKNNNNYQQGRASID